MESRVSKPNSTPIKRPSLELREEAVAEDRRQSTLDPQSTLSRSKPYADGLVTQSDATAKTAVVCTEME